MTKIGIGVLIIVLISSGVDLLLVRRYHNDGILFADYAADADSVRYTVTAGEGWENLNTLAEQHGLFGKAMFCSRGPGGWILYPEFEFKFGSNRQVKLLSGELCVPADKVNSIQPLSAINEMEDFAAVLHFPETYFAAKGTTHRIGDASATIKSIIFIGQANWTLTVGGNKICIATLAMDGHNCLIEDVQAAFETSEESITIARGCDDVELLYHPQSCYGAGLHTITYEFDFTLNSMKSICTDSADEDSTDKFMQVMRVWKHRINEDPGDYHFPTNIPNAPQRLSVLWQMMKIIGDSCPSLDPEYLEIVKILYVTHTNFGAIWNTTAGDATIQQDPLKWLTAQSFISDCALQLRPNDPSIPVPPVSHSAGSTPALFFTDCDGPADVQTMKSEMEESAIEDFLLGDHYDFVIEQIWLILNYVSPYCNSLTGFKNNYWSEFPLLFKHDFLYPLVAQWKNPGKWASYYPIMFNGYDLDTERKHMISCVQAIIQTTPYFDPLARPPGFFNESTKTPEMVEEISQGGKKPPPPPPVDTKPQPEGGAKSPPPPPKLAAKPPKVAKVDGEDGGSPPPPPPPPPPPAEEPAPEGDSERRKRQKSDGENSNENDTVLDGTLAEPKLGQNETEPAEVKEVEKKKKKRTKHGKKAKKSKGKKKNDDNSK